MNGIAWGGGGRRLKKEGGRSLGQTTAVDAAVYCRKLAGIRTASTQGKVDDRSLREGGDRRRGEVSAAGMGKMKRKRRKVNIYIYFRENYT